MKNETYDHPSSHSKMILKQLYSSLKYKDTLRFEVNSVTIIIFEFQFIKLLKSMIKSLGPPLEFTLFGQW